MKLLFLRALTSIKTRNHAHAIIFIAVKKKRVGGRGGGVGVLGRSSTQAPRLRSRVTANVACHGPFSGRGGRRQRLWINDSLALIEGASAVSPLVQGGDWGGRGDEREALALNVRMFDENWLYN